MKTKRINILLLILLIFGSPSFIYSQACCTGGAPLSSNLGIVHYKPNQLVVDLSYDYNKINKLYAGSTKLDDNQRERITKSSILRLSYALTNRFSLTAILPYVWQEQTVRSVVGSNRQAANGIGDFVLLGQYSLIQSRNNQLIVAAGPKFPTGSTSKRGNEFDILLPPDLQPGTGSWDGIGAISYVRSGFSRPTLSLISLVSYRYSFEVGRYDGQQKYRFGNELAINIGASDSFNLGKHVIKPSLQYRFRHTQKDENNGSEFPNTGGSWMYLVPAVNIQLSPSLQVHSNVEIPIHANVVGTQLITSFKGNIGLNYTINFKKAKYLK